MPGLTAVKNKGKARLQKPNKGAKQVCAPTVLVAKSLARLQWHWLHCHTKKRLAYGAGQLVMVGILGPSNPSPQGTEGLSEPKNN